MKIYLIKTPDYDTAHFRVVCELLNSFEGPMEFISSFYEFDKEEFNFLQYDLYPYHHFDTERESSLSWNELFSLCTFYREMINIEEESFVVLLTKRKNDLNWFSAVDESRNIFVHTAEWELYTRVNAKYPIAYQVVENVLQSLMNIDINNVPNEFVHEPLRGCMNDFCNDKTQIIVKLQTANICETCINKIREEHIDSSIVRQVKNIFNGIRNEFIFQEEDDEAILTDPGSIIVEPNGSIHLVNQNLEIRLNPLFKTLYLFFLSKSEGVTLVQLSDFKDVLFGIYKRIRPSASDEDAKKRIKRLVHPGGEGFNPTKAHINKIITQLLNEPLASFYRISGERGSSYSVNLPMALKDIRF